MKSRRMPIAQRLIAAALLSGVWIAGAAAKDAHVKNIRLAVAVQSGQIYVYSSNGVTWDTILPNELLIHARGEVDTRWPGYVVQVGYFLGHCSNTGCASFPLLFAEPAGVRDYDRIIATKFSPTQLPALTQSEILAGCNRTATSPTQRHSFFRTVEASFSANTSKSTLKNGFEPVEGLADFNGGDHTAHDAFTVTVNCMAYSTVTSPPQRHNVKVEDIKLFLTTYGGQASAGRTPGASSCKPLKVTTRIETDKEGPVKVKLWRKIDNGPTTDEIRTLDAKALGGDKFGADWDKWEHFGKTTYAQYMAEIIGGTFAPSTPWKDITIHCGGNFADTPQGGGGPVNPNPLYPGVVAEPPKLSCAGGVVKGNDCVCPRGHKEVQVGANAYRCLPNTGVVADPPKLSCAGGVVKNNDCICPRGNKEVQVGPNAYRCVANEPSGPKISCAGGTLKGNDCVCPRGTKEIKVGANAYRCVQNVTQPTPTKAKALAAPRNPVVPPRRTITTTGQRVR